MNYFPVPRRRMLACAISLLAYLISAPGMAGTTRAPDTVAVADFSSCAKPVWPKAALRQEQHGTVTLEFQIAADGTVAVARLIKSSGFPLLDTAAREAIAKCRFKPAMAAGVAVQAWTRMQYVWALEGPARSTPLPVHVPFQYAPAELRDFLVKAKAADTIADPLQRCMAFPDLPNNKWAAGLPAAYCHLLFDELITAKQVADHLDRGALGELEARYRRDLDRHFSKDNFSEVIHRDYLQFDADDDSAKLTARWIEKMPDSPFAHAARGWHLERLAWKVRGTKFINETPEADVERMSAIARSAVEQFGIALTLEPRLLPAHAGLINLAQLTGSDELAELAFARANAVDPASRELSKAKMGALVPRWGGSMEEMQDYARELEPMIAARPLLALSIILPPLEEGNIAYRKNDYAATIKVLEPAAMLAPFPDLYSQLGVSMYYNSADAWQTLARLLVAYRYDTTDFEAARARGSMMLAADEPAWALQTLQAALALKPADLHTSYLIGKAQFALFEYELAEPFLVKGLGAPAAHDDALYVLTEAMLRARQLDKADTHSSAYVRAYPKSARGWTQRADLKERQRKLKEALACLATFLKVVDRSEPGWKNAIAFAEKTILASKSKANAGATRVSGAKK
ncbi:MAG: TonB family protein [Pseudomonadota bacterium]